MADTAAGLRVERATDDELDFTAYVAARRKALLRTAYLLTGDHHTAEDLVQTALARVFSRWSRIKDRGAVDAYVRRALLNEHLGLWRRAWRRLEHSTDQIPENPSPQPVVESTDVDEQLWNAIQALAPRQRAVIVLRYYENLSEAEIAAVLGCSPGTVKSTSSRSMTKLREYLEVNR
jgi:RNA polymerase sigma-70 factor (sigma-E family)